jgi:hypothetical protein
MSEQLTLFGGVEKSKKIIISPRKSKYQMFKLKNNYRKSSDKNICCKTCNQCKRKQYQRVYYKCLLLGNSNGPATDIRLRYICNLWEGDINE